MNLEAFWWDDDLIHLGEWVADEGVRFPGHSDISEPFGYGQSDSPVACHRCRTWAQEQIDALQELLR